MSNPQGRGVSVQCRVQVGWKFQSDKSRLESLPISTPLTLLVDSYQTQCSTRQKLRPRKKEWVREMEDWGRKVRVIALHYIYCAFGVISFTAMFLQPRTLCNFNTVSNTVINATKNMTFHIHLDSFLFFFACSFLCTSYSYFYLQFGKRWMSVFFILKFLLMIWSLFSDLWCSLALEQIIQIL